MIHVLRLLLFETPRAVSITGQRMILAEQAEGMHGSISVMPTSFPGAFGTSSLRSVMTFFNSSTGNPLARNYLQPTPTVKTGDSKTMTILLMP